MDMRPAFTTYDDAHMAPDGVSYVQLLAQVAAAQAKTVTAQCQSQIGTTGIGANLTKICSFHATTAKLLSAAQES